MKYRNKKNTKYQTIFFLTKSNYVEHGKRLLKNVGKRIMQMLIIFLLNSYNF